MEAAMAMREHDRADVYALLAALLFGADAEVLAALPDAPPWPGSPPAAPAWDALRQAAARCSASAAAEFEALFVSAGTPALNPYECYYVAGCLMDKPLALLRTDLRVLGLVRNDGSTELEDHLGALCEAMRILIERGADAQLQADFFRKHLARWAGGFLHDLRSAPAADFYRAVADFTEAFFAGEAALFDIEPPAPPGDEPTAYQWRTGALQP
ncbi:MAG TPA: molecular chaperone TorD family protein [Ramlibacter sp.]|jgi:TorA maturation chaperone TorD